MIQKRRLPHLPQPDYLYQMAKQSAGLLPYRKKGKQTEVMLVHPGGPYRRHKDAGAWSIVKGEFAEGEAAIDAARREFQEETGMEVSAPLLPLMPVRQKNGKTVYAWAVQMDIDTTLVRSNAIDIEWPPRSGRVISIPEIDRAEWFALSAARAKIIPAQVALLDELERTSNGE